MNKLEKQHIAGKSCYPNVCFYTFSSYEGFKEGDGFVEEYKKCSKGSKKMIDDTKQSEPCVRRPKKRSKLIKFILG